MWLLVSQVQQLGHERGHMPDNAAQLSSMLLSVMCINVCTTAAAAGLPWRFTDIQLSSTPRPADCLHAAIVTLHATQEVTPNILQLFHQSPWWDRYTASQPPPQPYFTLLLYRKDVFKPLLGGFQEMPFPNSAMGENWTCLLCVCCIVSVGCLQC